jgi:hypothetical protein
VTQYIWLSEFGEHATPTRRGFSDAEADKCEDHLGKDELRYEHGELSEDDTARCGKKVPPQDPELARAESAGGADGSLVAGGSHDPANEAGWLCPSDATDRDDNDQEGVRWSKMQWQERAHREEEVEPWQRHDGFGEAGEDAVDGSAESGRHPTYETPDRHRYNARNEACEE